MIAPVREIRVGPAVFFVRTPWAVVQQYISQLAEAEADGGEYERQRRVEEATLAFLRRVIVGWRGVKDAEDRAVAFSPDKIEELDATVVAELLARLWEPPRELRPSEDVEWTAVVNSYVDGWPINDAPLALVLDMLLSRYPGYTAAALMQEDYHIVQALMDIACAANQREADAQWQ